MTGARKADAVVAVKKHTNRRVNSIGQLLLASRTSLTTWGRGRAGGGGYQWVNPDIVLQYDKSLTGKPSINKTPKN